jgi:hypothetical protein
LTPLSGAREYRASPARRLVMADLQQQFEVAQKAARKLRAKPDNDTLLELDSNFKQAT